MKKFLETYGLSLDEIKRLVLMAVLILVCFYPDWGALKTSTFIGGVFFAIALISHVTRKYALFPYLDMKQYAEKALENSIGAAIVFASVCGVIIVSINTASAFFAK